jgi:hypothetical protein
MKTSHWLISATVDSGSDNASVRDYRNQCESFPSNLVANVFGFKPEGDFFSVPPSVRDVPDVDFTS